MQVYIKQECVEWLKEVYFNKEEHYLTLEIKFYKKDASQDYTYMGEEGVTPVISVIDLDAEDD